MNGANAGKRIAQRLAFSLYVIGIAGFIGILPDVGHIPAVVYRWLGKIPPAHWLGRPFEIPYLLGGIGLCVAVCTLFVGLCVYAWVHIGMARGRVDDASY